MNTILKICLQTSLINGRSKCFLKSECTLYLSKQLFFHDNEIKMVRFNTQKDFIKKSNFDIDACKSRINDFLSTNNPNQELLSNDLNRFIYLARNEEEIDLVVKSILKLKDFEKINELDQKYKFGPTLARLLHTTNMLDKAIILFKNKDTQDILRQEFSTILIILDGLIEGKKFESGIKFYEDCLITYDRLPNSVLTAITLCIFRANTAKSLEKAKKLVDSLLSKKLTIGINSIVHVFFLAIYQKDYNYAISFLAKNKRIHKTLFNNLFIIGLSSMDFVEQAFKFADVTLEINTPSQEGFKTTTDGMFYVLTLKYLTEAVTRAKNEKYIAKLKELNQNIANLKRLHKDDLVEYFSNKFEQKEPTKFSQTNNKE